MSDPVSLLRSALNARIVYLRRLQDTAKYPRLKGYFRDRIQSFVEVLGMLDLFSSEVSMSEDEARNIVSRL